MEAKKTIPTIKDKNGVELTPVEQGNEAKISTFDVKFHGEVRKVVHETSTFDDKNGNPQTYHHLLLSIDDDEENRVYLKDSHLEDSVLYAKGVTGTFILTVEMQIGFYKNVKAGTKVTVKNFIPDKE